MQDLMIVHERIDALMPALRNARTHSKKQIRQIAESIKQFDFLNPVLVGPDRRIVAGHGRVEAARSLGWATVPVIHAHSLTPSQLRAYAIAENKLSELGGWDSEVLSLEFQELVDLDLGFDPTSIGFEAGEIDLLLDDPSSTPEEAAVSAPVRTTPAVSVLGDIWEIGNHCVICADAREPETYQRLLGSERAEMIISDPPYNVRVDGHVSGLGRTTHSEFVMGSGEMSSLEFTAFLATIIKQLIAFSVDGSIHFLFMDFRHMAELLAAGTGAYSELKNLCVWTKTNAGMGSLYRSQHELVFVFKAGTTPHINNIQLGKHGRYRTNVWRYGGANAFGKDRDADLAAHPTVKPVALVADAIMDCSTRNGIVLDAFLGSGTALVAAERTGRRGRGIELDPYYVDLAIDRISAAVGQTARHAETGMTFEAVRRARQPEDAQ